MCRCLAYFLCVSPLLTQTVQTAPQQAPIDALIQSYQSAIRSGKYDEAAATRDLARALLVQITVDDPQFANWAQRVSQLYDSGGFALKGRDVLEQALARAGGLSESSPVRVALLDAMARYWMQDRNLLKAVSYLEQALTASEAQPKQPAQTPAPSPSPWFSVKAAISATRPVANRVIAFSGGNPGSNNEDLYRRLLSLYHQLGRPQDAAAVLTRISTHVKNGDGLLASLYQQQGQIDEAAAIYKREAAQAADPHQAAFASQSLANLYQSAQRYGEAVGAMQQAIGKIEVSGGQEASLGMRQSLANLLQQAGQVQAADEVYRQLMAAPTNQPTNIVTSYANFLEQTNRVDQAEKLLNDFQASHSSGEPWEQSELMRALANVEQLSGKTQLAEEYQRRAFPNQARVPKVRSVDDMELATEAFNAGKLDEALNLTLHTIDSAVSPSDLERAYPMAQLLESRQAHAKADEIYRHAMALAESWSAATVEPLLRAQEIYAGALRNEQRWSEFEQAQERHSATLIAVRGTGTGWLEDSLRLRTGLLQPERLQDSLAASQQLVKLEESLDGDTSEPYLHAIEALATAMEANEDRAGALPLRRKTVTIADLVYAGSNERQRGVVRVNAAMAYASAGQFDEAEALAKEAIAIGEQMHPAQTGFAGGSLWQILQMKQAAQAASAPKR